MSHRLFLSVLAATTAVMASSAVQAEVFEIKADGNMVEITNPNWHPEIVVPEQAFVPQTAALVSLAAPVRNSVVRQHIQYAAARYGISGALVDAVAWQESRYNHRARSSVGAIGVMQLMPGTARQLGVTDPTNLHENIMGGAAYLRKQLDRFGNNVPLALAAYNAGPGAVQKYGGIPPYRETRNYVRQIMGRMAQSAFTYGGN